jgi:hypothetical protein
MRRYCDSLHSLPRKEATRTTICPTLGGSQQATPAHRQQRREANLAIVAPSRRRCVHRCKLHSFNQVCQEGAVIEGSPGVVITEEFEQETYGWQGNSATGMTTTRHCCDKRPSQHLVRAACDCEGFRHARFVAVTFLSHSLREFAGVTITRTQQPRPQHHLVRQNECRQPVP